jgi:hypothetical protein
VQPIGVVFCLPRAKRLSLYLSWTQLREQASDRTVTGLMLQSTQGRKRRRRGSRFADAADSARSERGGLSVLGLSMFTHR